VNAPVPLLATSGLGKSYPGVRALDGVDIDLRAGEVHALCGENGAGKSTLIKILGGILPAGDFEGSFRLAGRECRFRGSKDALAAGIRIIHQELALAGDLTVAENVFLGREPLRGGLLDANRMEAETARQLAALGIPQEGPGGIRPDQPVRELSVGLRQMVEIARALLPGAGSGKDGGSGDVGRVLILDEPTSALSLRESQALLELVLALRKSGLGILYISHKLDEVFAIADRLTVLRNGRAVATLDRAAADPEKLVSLMVGRGPEEDFPVPEPLPAQDGPPLLSVRGWTLPSPVNPEVRLLEDVSFEIRRGEIVGLAGLLGAGRTELAESLFGLATGGGRGTGEVRIQGEPYFPTSPGHAVRRGLALVPEDRRRHGLMVEKSIRHNLTAACLERFCRWRQVIDEDAELRQTRASMAELGVKAPDGEFTAAFLSGGNQQKVVLAKWLAARPRVLFLDDPTRGVDVGAKSEIYRLIRKLARDGHGVLLISSEHGEVLGLSHRVLVLRQGRLVAEFAHGRAEPETILSLCAGGSPAASAVQANTPKAGAIPP
jgi:D-xylose transport system ATP-binding protein